jgi:S1-C subfamily serine protease
LVVSLAAIAVLIAAGVGAVIGHVAWTSSTTPVTSPIITAPPPTAPISSSPGAPSNSASIAAGVDPALVDIEVTDSYQSVEGFGTGMVLSSSGEVLTNNHVIEGETSISVRDVGNGKTYGATVAGYDVTQDMAVIQLTGASGLETVKLGDSSDLKVGQGVVAIGNAEGAGGTPSYSSGSITALDQSIRAQDEISRTSEQLTGLIETNADVVPGDSGGALANSAGAIIGMVTAGSAGFQFQGTSNEGYAIPINEALGIARQIKASQASSTVHIGPTAFLGVEVMSPFSGISGAEIVGVVPTGPAAAAGLSTGDVITGFDGQPVSSPESLTGPLLGETPGTSVQLRYLDPSGLQHTVSVTLASGPPQ